MNMLKFRRRRPRYRVLRRYSVSMALKWHDCGSCCVPISPGQSYQATVTAVEGRIVVQKYHAPSCPEDPDGERAEREADELAELRNKEVSRKKRAA